MGLPGNGVIRGIVRRGPDSIEELWYPRTDGKYGGFDNLPANAADWALTMYHLPRGKTWDAVLLADALRKRGVHASLDADRITVTLPIAAINIERNQAVTSVADFWGEIVGETAATLTFAPDAVLENIILDLDIAACVEGNFPRIDYVLGAVLDCGYDSGCLREIAKTYSHREKDIDRICDQIEVLVVAKESALADSRFSDARTLADEEHRLRRQVETLVKESIVFTEAPNQCEE